MSIALHKILRLRLTGDPELVLSSLVESLVFSPGPEVFWENIGLARPVVVGQEELGKKMPLTVSIAAP